MACRHGDPAYRAGLRRGGLSFAFRDGEAPDGRLLAAGHRTIYANLSMLRSSITERYSAKPRWQPRGILERLRIFGAHRRSFAARRTWLALLGSDRVHGREQNAQWYRLYKSVENEPAVIDAHRHFLLTRDYAAIAFLLLLSAGPLGIWFISSMTTAEKTLSIIPLACFVNKTYNSA
jgi:hypothetical protein